MKMEECTIVCRLEVAEHGSLVDKSQKLSKDLANVNGSVDKNAISIVQATITIYVPPLPYPALLSSNDSFCKRATSSWPSPSLHSTQSTAAAVQPYKAEVNKYVQSCTRHTLPSADVVTGSSHCTGSSSSAARHTYNNSDVASVVYSVEEPSHKIVEDSVWTKNNSTYDTNNNKNINNSSSSEILKKNQDKPQTTDNRELLRKIAENYRILNRRDVPKRLMNNNCYMSRTKMRRIADKYKTGDNVHTMDTDIQEKKTTLIMNTTSCETDETNINDRNTEPKSKMTVQLDRSQFDNELNSLLDSRSVEVKNNAAPHQETERYSDDSSITSSDSCRESSSSLEEYLMKKYAKHQAQGKCCDMFILTRRQKELRKIQEEFSQMTEEEELPPVEYKSSSTTAKRMSSKMKKKQALLATFRKSRYSKVKTIASIQTNGQSVNVSPKPVTPTSFSSSSDSESLSGAHRASKHTSIHSESVASSPSDTEYSSLSDADNHSVQGDIVASKSETLVTVTDDESTINSITPAVPSASKVKSKIRALSSESLTKYLVHMKQKQRNSNTHNSDSQTATNNNAITLGDDVSAGGVLNGQLMVTGDVANSGVGDTVDIQCSAHIHNNSISVSDSVSASTTVASSTIQCSVSSSTRKIIRRPRKKRVSRKLFHHDTIRYIKPRKRVQLRKTFSPSLINLVDKSIQISRQKGIPKMNKNGQTTLKSILRNVRKPKPPQLATNGSQDGNCTQFTVEVDVHNGPGSAISSCADIVSYKDHSIRTKLTANNTQGRPHHRVSWRLDTDSKNNSSSSSTQRDNNSTTSNTAQDCDAILHATSCEPAQCSAQPQRDNSKLNNVQPTHSAVSDIVISDVRSIGPCMSDAEVRDAQPSDNSTQISAVPQYLLEPRQTTDPNANEPQHSKWNELLTREISKEQLQQLLIHSYDDNARLQNINRRLHSIHQPLTAVPPSTNSNGPRERTNNNEETETLRAEQSAHNQNQQQLQQSLIVKSNTEGRQKRTYTRRQPTKPKQNIEVNVMAKQLRNYQQIQLLRPPPPPYPGQPNHPGGLNELSPNGRNVIALHQYSKKIPSTLAPPQSYRSTLSHMANPTVPRLSTDTGQPTSPALDLRYSVNDIPITQVHSSTNIPQLTRTTDTLPTSPVACKYSPSTTTMHSPIQNTVDKLVTQSRVERSTVEHAVQPTVQTGNENTIQKTLETENRETKIRNPVQSPPPVVHSSTLVEAKSPTLPATNEHLENQETQVKTTISVETQTAFDSAVSHSETEQCPTICKTSSDSTSNNTAVASNADTPRSHKPTIRNRPRARRYCETPQSVKFRRLVIRHNFRRRIASRASRTPVTSRQDHSYSRTTQVTSDNKNKVKDETSPVQNNNKPLPTTRRQDNADTSMETPDRMNIPVNFYTLSDQQPVYASAVINQGNEVLQLAQAYIETVQNNQEAMRVLQQSLRELIANVNTSGTVKGEHKDSNSKILHTEQILQQFLANQKNIRTEFVIRHELVTTVTDTSVKQQLTDSLVKYLVLLKTIRDSEPNVSSASATTTLTAEEQHVKTQEQSTSEEQETTGQQDTISSSNSNTSINSNNSSSNDSTKSSSDCNEPAVNVQLPWSVKQAKVKNTEQSACVSVVDHSLPSTSKSVPSLVDSNQSSGEEQVTGPSQDDGSTTTLNITSETQDTTTVSKDERLNVLHKYALCKLEERKLDNNKWQQQQRPVTNTREDNKIVRELLDNGVQIEYSIPIHRAADPDAQQHEVNNNVPSVNPVQNISARDTTPANNPNTTDVCKVPERPRNQQQHVQTPISTTTTHNQQPTVITANQPRLQQIVSQPREVRVTPAVSYNNQGNQSAQLTNRTDLPYTITRPPPAATNTSHSDISLAPVSLGARGTGAQPAALERQDTSHMPLQLTSSRMDDILLMIPTASKPNIHLYAPQSATSEQRSSENERLLSLPASNIPEYQHVTTQPSSSTPYLNKRQVPVTTSAGNTRKRARTSYTNIPEAAPTVALPAAATAAALPPPSPPLAPAPRVVEPMRPADFLAAVDQRLNNTDNLIRTLIYKKKDRKRSSSTATSVRNEELVSQSPATSLDSYNTHIPFNPSQTSINQHQTPRLSSFNVPAYQRPVYPNVQMIRPQLYHAGEHLQYRPPPPAWLSARIPAPPPAGEPLHVPVRQAESPLTLLSTMVQEHPRTSGDRARRQSEPFQAALQYNTEHSTAYMNSIMAPPKQVGNPQERISSQRRNHTADSAQPHPELYRQFLNFIQQSGLQVNNHNYSGTSDSTPILYPVIQMPPFPAEVLQSKRYNTLLSKYYQKPTLMKYTNTNYNNSKHTTNTKCQYKYGRRVHHTCLTDYNNNIITCNSNKNNKNTTVVRDVHQPITYPYPSDYIHRQFEQIHGKSRLSDMYNTLGIRCYSNKRYVHTNTSSMQYVNNTRQSHATDTITDQSRQVVVVAGKGKSIDSLFGINRVGGKHAIQMARARLQVEQLNSFIENNRRMLVQDSEQCIGPETLNAYIVTNIKEIHRLFEIVILTDTDQYYRSLWCMWSVSDNKHLYHFYKLVTHLQIRVGQIPFAIRIFIDLLRRKYLCTIRKLAEDQCNQ